MANEITTVNPMSMLNAAIEKGLDTQALEKLMDLQERWEANESKKAFEAALVRFQSEVPEIPKSGTIMNRDGRTVRSTYAKYEDIKRLIKRYMEDAGLSHRCNAVVDRTETGTYITVTTKIAHKSGYSETSTFECPIDPNMQANNSQKMASANSYAKRIGLMNALGLVAEDEDDDGEAGGTATITEDQAQELDALVKKLPKGDHAKVIAWMKRDTPSLNHVGQLPASRFMEVKRVLSDRVKKQEQAA